MGSCWSFSDKIQPQELNHFVEGDSQDSSGSQNVPSRSCTDVCFIAVFAGFLIGLVILLIYCILNGDIYRVLNGYDDCLNVCGRQNDRVLNYEPESCEVLDMRQKPFLLQLNNSQVTGSSKRRQCVADCNTIPGSRQFLNRCISGTNDKLFPKSGLKNFFKEAAEDIHLCWKEILYLCLIASGFSIFIMVVFRFFVGIVIWIVLLGVTAASISGTIYLWWLYKNSSESYLAYAIISTVVTVCVLLIILVLRKRVQLVVQLFKEAGKAVSSMPMLIFQPILTFAVLFVTIILWIYFSLWIESSGVATKNRNGDYYLMKDKAMMLTRWYNVLAVLWMVQFIIGCQHMIIAGAVSSWYFVRDKTTLGTPIFTSGHNLLRYHLGSVALGSLIISVVQFIRLILSYVQSLLKNKEGNCVKFSLKCCQCCLMCFERILKFLSRNAYIEVAMYGYSFCRAGRQAFKLLASNGVRVAVINSVGDFVLFLGKIFVVVATVLIGIEMLKSIEGINHRWVPICVAGLFAYFVSDCFITVYEMAIDTIFLCFCEDCEQNDGISKPYFMSKDLMEYVENSKKALAYLDKTGNGFRSEAWQENRPPTISERVS